MTPKQEEALRDYLQEVIVPLIEEVLVKKLGQAMTFAKKALAEQPAQQDSTCSNALRAQGKAYPRTCKKCGLGPCVELAQQALDKKAENARELGLDYEPAQQEPVAWMDVDGNVSDNNDHKCFPIALYTSPQTQRTWVSLTEDEISLIVAECSLVSPSDHYFAEAIEAKLRSKNT